MTHASADPGPGLQFMLTYLNVEKPGDECRETEGEADLCECSSGVPNILQGRVYTVREDHQGSSGPAGNGFGLHLVAVPGHGVSVNGRPVEFVEEQYTSKFNRAVKTGVFDVFMDNNVVLQTSCLQTFKNRFSSDGVGYYSTIWKEGTTNYDSIIVQVNRSQLFLQLVQEKTVSSKREAVAEDDTTGCYLVQMAINRGVSSIGKFHEVYTFYEGMKVTSEDRSTPGISKRCYTWAVDSGADETPICYSHRVKGTTHGDFTLGDMEQQLLASHRRYINSSEYHCCTGDRWFDNHYAIDARNQDQQNTDIINYINGKEAEGDLPLYTCASNRRFGGSSLKALFDPTGLGIQMDTNTATSDLKCNSCASSQFSSAGHTNPACDTTWSNCPSGTEPTEAIMEIV